ncbi:DUF2076 domain-containing protein [Microvirga terricola]|uniref:DUF2076 domain-containing protein n=1 Tax=Microvirga terricola TaxID=2719797 RepID=A0ABX0VI00_9HYPH|nr:DUF2076 domain-containing protein [Microvirga terricola]NIX78057.1 DUF2076 domain-containing protein [Microvirga terricola]
MNDQEREVIADIFRRLEQVASQPRDPEAERFIADKVREQPYAPYAMAQAIFVQEQALKNLQAANEQLRAELEQVRRQPQAQGGFLSGLFGGGARPPEPDYRESPRPSPWGGSVPQVPPQPQQPYGQPYGAPQGAPGGPWGGSMMQQRPGGGFLQGALSTAAGVAGGVMIANALSHAFGGGQAGAGEKSALADLGGNQSGSFDQASITDSLYPKGQDNQTGPEPDEPDDDFSDMGGDNGDDGDWI